MGLIVPHKSAAMCRALSGIEDGEVDYERLDVLSKEKAEEYFPLDPDEFYEKVAKFHGIKSKILRRSSSREELYKEYCYAMTKEFIKNMKNELILTDVQAWALLSQGAGLLSEAV